MPPPLPVVLDANILYSETLADVFVRLAEAQRVAVVWSDRIREEWLLAVSRNRPDLAPAWLDARDAQLAQALNWTCVSIDDAALQHLTLPDQNDRHVLAAAIAARAGIIVTSNLRDFPKRTLASHGIRALTADAIMREWLATEPAPIVAAICSGGMEAGRMEAAGLDFEAYLERLRRAGLARSVKMMRSHLLGGRGLG